MRDKLKGQLKNYNLLKSYALSAFHCGEYEKALDYIQVAAKMAAQSYMGLWYDDELEDLLSKIGKNLRKSSHKKKSSRTKNTVYILTFLNSYGGACLGHCQAFKQWTKLLGSDPEKEKVYVTHCYTLYNSSVYSKNVGNMPTQNLSWQDSYSNRINALINYINDDSPDEIVLFINPDDVVAISAIYALDKKPKVLFFNHADHSFWLGRNLIDILIEFREEGAKYSKNYRNIDNSQIVPLITEIKPIKTSKKEWSIKESSTVSISIGNLLKVLDDDLIYFKLIEELLNKFPDHYHIFITHYFNKSMIKSYFKDYDKIKDRFIITGPILDLSEIYGLGDFLIETFPLSGSTVRMEAMACKLPIVAYYNQKFPLASSKDYFPDDYPFIGSKNDELINYCEKFIGDPELRKKTGEKLYEHYLEEFTFEKASKTVKNILSSSENRVNIRYGKINYNYDLEYARKLLVKNKAGLNEQLLFQSIYKYSKFSIMDKINFYSRAVKKSEFKSKKLAILHLFLPFVGFKGISLGRKFVDKMLNVINH